MLKGVNLNRINSFYDFVEHPSITNSSSSHQIQAAIEELEAIYGCDEFRMYAYKIKRCSRTRSHDWTECPYAHRGEKATRRDPRKVPYIAIACSGFRNGRCHKGDACEYAHGVFEYWLHPSRYRTRACNSGRFCQRKVCFFAHTPDQLRSDKKYVCPLVYRARMSDGGSAGDGILGSGSPVCEDGGGSSTPAFGSPVRVDGGSYFEGVSEFLDSLRSLKIRDCDEMGVEKSGGGGLVEVLSEQSDLPQIDWVSELVK